MSILEPRSPEENVIRGTLFALLAIPVGVTAFVVIWNIGIVASIVSFATAWLAVFLYRIGAGGTISRIGAFCITGVVVVAVGLSIFAGLVSEAAIAFGSVTDFSPFAAVTMPEFWIVFNEILATGEVMGEYALPILLAVVFAALGVFSTLRGIFKSQDAAAEVQGHPEYPAAAQNPAAFPAPADDVTDPKAPNAP